MRKVAVIGNSRNSGTTASALLIGGALVKHSGAKVMIVPTANKQYEGLRYSGYYKEDDLTRSFTQLLNMVRTGFIKMDSVPNYAYAVMDNLDVFDTDDSRVPLQDRNDFFKELINQFPYDIVVFDCNSPEGINDKVQADVLREADIVIWVLSQDALSLEKFKSIDMSKLNIAPGKVKYFISKFNSNVGSLTAVAKEIGTNPSNIGYISYNPKIQSLSNSGDFKEIFIKAHSSYETPYRLIGANLVHINKKVSNWLGLNKAKNQERTKRRRKEK